MQPNFKVGDRVIYTPFTNNVSIFGPSRNEFGVIVDKIKDILDNDPNYLSIRWGRRVNNNNNFDGHHFACYTENLTYSNPRISTTNCIALQAKLRKT